ncbi:hypothetical protein J4E91_000759 [Alternaria rosae]|nr:hypothetical protein J4E91_000759 [Alternaria rosae]
MSKTKGKPTSMFQETEQPVAEIRTYGSVQKQISSNPLPPSAAAVGSSSSTVIQQRKPNPGAISKFKKMAQLSGRGHNTSTNNAAPEKHSLSPGDVLKVSRPEAAKRSQDHAQVFASKSRKSTSNVPNADTADSKFASSAPGQPAQKRKLDIISDGSGKITGPAFKRPALTSTTSSKRPGSAIPALEDDNTPGSVVAPRISSREVPTKTSDVPRYTANSSAPGNNTGSARSVKQHKSALPSPSYIGTPADREGSEAVPKDAYVTPAVLRVPAHPRGASANKPTERSSKSLSILLPESDSVSQPDIFAATSREFKACKSPKATENAPAALDRTKSAHFKCNFSGTAARSSLEPSVSLEKPIAINSYETLSEELSERDAPHGAAAMSQIEKASNASMIEMLGGSKQIAEPDSISQEKHHVSHSASVSEVSLATPSEPLVSIMQERASTPSTTVCKPAFSKESRKIRLTEPSTTDMGLTVPTDRVEKEVLHSEQSWEASTLMDVDSLDHATAGTSSVFKATDDKPIDQLVAIVQKANEFPTTDLNPTSSAKTIENATKTAVTPPVSAPNRELVPLDTMTDTNEEILDLNGLPGISNEAQPYFEYSVFQKTWQGEQVESTLSATEITVRPFTSLDDANAQAEKVFQSNSTLFNDVIFEKSNNRDEHGCFILTGSITPFDNPANKSHLKIWVQRDFVSALANQTPQAIKGTSFISSTCYILRLFKLIIQADADDSSSSSSSDAGTDSTDPPTQEPVRAYHAHTRPEIYTTLSAANRAARALQIQLSHEKEPKDALSKAFQEKNLRELNAKVVQLQSPSDEGGGCWKSRFNACGLGGDNLELVVEKTSLCGPRNL